MFLILVSAHSLFIFPLFSHSKFMFFSCDLLCPPCIAISVFTQSYFCSCSLSVVLSLSLCNDLSLSIVFLCFLGCSSLPHSVMIFYCFCFSCLAGYYIVYLCSYFVIYSIFVVVLGFLLSLDPSSSRLHFLGVCFPFCLAKCSTSRLRQLDAHAKIESRKHENSIG